MKVKGISYFSGTDVFVVQVKDHPEGEELEEMIR